MHHFDYGCTQSDPVPNQHTQNLPALTGVSTDNRKPLPIFGGS